MASSEEVQEEADYVNAAVCTVEKKEVTSGQKFLSFARCFAAVAVCFLILSVIVALWIYFTSVISAKNTKMTARNNELETQIQQLETEKKNLTQQINDTKTERNELNVSRAQWSIDAYCPKENNVRVCKRCQKGWLLFNNSCFVFNNAETQNRKTWEEAREDCREINSDLAVVANEAEKNYIRNWGVGKFWIGLRAEGGKWKWLDGSDLTETSWIQQQPADDGHCGIYVKDNNWKSDRCDTKLQWICEKKALSV